MTPINTTPALPPGVTVYDVAPNAPPRRHSLTYDEASQGDNWLHAKAIIRRWIQTSAFDHVIDMIGDGVSDAELLASAKFLRAEVRGDFEKAFNE